jgi:hypothetical protein
MLAGSMLAVCRAWVNRQRVSTFWPTMAVAASRAWVTAAMASSMSSPAVPGLSLLPLRLCIWRAHIAQRVRVRRADHHQAGCPAGLALVRQAAVLAQRADAADGRLSVTCTRRSTPCSLGRRPHARLRRGRRPLQRPVLQTEGARTRRMPGRVTCPLPAGRRCRSRSTRLRQHRTRRHSRASAIAVPAGHGRLACPHRNGEVVVAKSNRRKWQDRVKADAKRAEQARRRAKAEREQQTAERYRRLLDPRTSPADVAGILAAELPGAAS